MNVGLELLQASVSFKECSRYFIVKCPKHEDNHPSLKIYKDSERCYCFSCGYSDFFSNYLRDNYSIVLDKDKINTRVKVYNSYPERLILSYPKGFTKCGEVKKLKLDKETIDYFNIGYCKYGYNIKKTGMCSNCFFNKSYKGVSYETKNGYCYFALNRVMIPITSKGVLYSIESRDLSGTNSRKILYPVLSKSSRVIFNLDNLDRGSFLYVVEGIKSALRLWQDLDKNVTAIFSNKLKGDQKEILKEFKNIIIIPDNGSAGKEMVRDIQNINDKALVVNLPKALLCKSCSFKFRGDEKKDICPNCKGDKISYCDAFDFSIDVIKRAIKVAEEKNDIFKRVGIKDINSYEKQR